MGVKARLPFIPLTDTDQMVRIAQVEFGEDRGMRKGLEGGMGYLFLTVMVFNWW